LGGSGNRLLGRTPAPTEREDEAQSNDWYDQMCDHTHENARAKASPREESVAADERYEPRGNQNSTPVRRPGE